MLSPNDDFLLTFDIKVSQPPCLLHRLKGRHSRFERILSSNWALLRYLGLIIHIKIKKSLFIPRKFLFRGNLNCILALDE